MSVRQAHAVHCPNLLAAAGQENVACAGAEFGGIVTFATVTAGMLVFVQI